MVKVILKPIDSDHKPVELSVGKTILGRGPLLGCSDKKVSRNHAVLEVNAEGEVFLTPTHVNPCFYRTKSDANPKMMKKDKALRLEPGDVFSLLPLTFQYQIMLPSSKEDASKDSTPDAVVDSKDQSQLESTEISSKETISKPEDEKLNVNPAIKADSQKESQKTGPSENGRPERTEEDAEMNAEAEDPEEEDLEEDEPESPKPKRRTTARIYATQRGKVKKNSEDSTTQQQASNQDQTLGRRKRTLPSWLIKSASMQQDNNGETVQKEDRGKRRSRTGQSEASSRSARQNRKTNQKISLEDFVVSEEDWNSENSGEGGGTGGAVRGSGGRRKRGRRRANADDSSGSDWEAEHKSQSQSRWAGSGRAGAKDASSGSDWETSAGARRSSRRGSARRRAHTGGDSESGSDWETDRKKKTIVPKKTRGRRSRKKSEEEDEDPEDEGNISDAGSKDSPVPTPTPTPTPTSNPTPKKDSPSNTRRKTCQFGRKCFRKNLPHLENFSHPGDSDYESPSEESNKDAESKGKKAAAKEEKANEDSSEEKPECPYGSECYRKNVQHRKDFQHTKKVRPKREASKSAAKRAKKNKDDDDDEEDVPYDLTDDDSNEFKPDDSEEK